MDASPRVEMVRQTHNEPSAKVVLKLLGQMPDGGRPLCDCKECGWKGVALKSLEMLANALNVARAAAFDGEAKNDTIKKAQGEAVSKEGWCVNQYQS